MFNKLKYASVVVASALVSVGGLVLAGVAHAQDYIIDASTTIPIFENTAAVGKANFVAVAGVGFPYYVSFMIALVLFVLLLLPIKKIWGVIAGHMS